MLMIEESMEENKFNLGYGMGTGNLGIKIERELKFSDKMELQEDEDYLQKSTIVRIVDRDRLGTILTMDDQIGREDSYRRDTEMKRLSS